MDDGDTFKLDYRRAVKKAGHWADEMHLWAPGTVFTMLGLTVLALAVLGRDEFNPLPVALTGLFFLVPGVALLAAWGIRNRSRNKPYL